MSRSSLPSARDLCRAASVDSTWARRVKDNEDVLWKPMVARRWRSLPQLGISARRPGSLERWGGENANGFASTDSKCFYPRGYEAQYAVGPRRLEMSLEDVLRILRAPRVDPGGGLRWV